MFDLKGKRALVTGSTQGIGYAIAKALIEHGAEVFIHCSADEDKARGVAAELGSSLWCVGNLSDELAVSRIRELTGSLDIVVANASVQIRKEWSAISSDEYRLQMDVNYYSTLQLMQAYIPDMQRGGWGRFLAIGSVQEKKPHVNMAVYAASKCAIKSLTQNVAAQVAKDGVTVNMIAPGVIATPRNDGALADKEYAQKVLSGIPAGFVGEPCDIAASALLFCSEEGRYINGAELYIDGGMAVK